MSILRFYFQSYTLENISSKDDTEVVIKSGFLTRLEHILVNVDFILNYGNLKFHYYHLFYGQE